MQAYTSNDGGVANNNNTVASIIEQRPMSKDKTARPIQTPGSQKANDPTGLVRETHNVPMNLADRTGMPKIDIEDDKA